MVEFRKYVSMRWVVYVGWWEGSNVLYCNIHVGLIARRTKILFFFLNHPPPPEISPLPQHAALPIAGGGPPAPPLPGRPPGGPATAEPLRPFPSAREGRRPHRRWRPRWLAWSTHPPGRRRGRR